MQQNISLRLFPAEAADENKLKQKIADQLSRNIKSISGYNILKKSIDARGRKIWINLSVQVFIDESYQKRKIEIFQFKDVHKSPKKVIIIGSGPAGLFAALRLIESGIKPVILERGKDVKNRRRDLAKLNKEGILNPESNYCFGEGGAGTYSDGKLYTRSNKRGNIDRILNLFFHFDAPENILFESHPHIGTNKLPGIISGMRQTILNFGGEVHFGKKLNGFKYSDREIDFVETQDGDQFQADAYILATGHSARDVFELLHHQNITIEAKPFALGVRVEHPQSLIDQLQYHGEQRNSFLPPSSYGLVQQIKGRGVFSFCMCPGGIIAPAATSKDELVVNGWSPSKRNNPFANSGMVVEVTQEDAIKATRQLKTSVNDPLLFMRFQKMVEQNAFAAGGGNFVAPAQRMVDFSNRKYSQSLPECSYHPGLHSADLSHVLPDFIYNSLAAAFKSFGKSMRDPTGNSFFTNEAVVVATESRTSSPVRIPRDNRSLNHPQLTNLYPCGEGAGYAGGIVSAAMDGEKVADAIVMKFGIS
jgi:uncharacterized protein